VQRRHTVTFQSLPLTGILISLPVRQSFPRVGSGQDYFGRPFIKRFALYYRSVVLSVLFVCDVRALLPNGWTDQDETWHTGRPRPWPHCVRWRPSSPSPKGHSPPIFGPYLLRPNGCMDQDVTWYGASVQWTLC